uniref:Pyridoxal phosphate phosphatase PHOSPHO2 n=1 Tax=Arion vulgaris TaxID=1028688 RepID=A0A0B6ZFU4_9EUPU
MSEQKPKRFLLVFDFDHSLIDENSDEYITKVAPGGVLPEEIKSLYEEDGWTDYMAEIFKYLHSNGIAPENILSCMSEIALTQGMKELLEFTSTAGCFDHIVISDSNSVFIEHILENKGLSSVINKVFTNPAEFDNNGCLTIKRYHTQDWCTLSTVNLCKGRILKTFIENCHSEGTEYMHVIYVGDGYNDLCPSLALRSEDTTMPRLGFKLHKLIGKIMRKNKPVNRSELKANVVTWETGFDVLKHIQTLIS